MYAVEGKTRTTQPNGIVIEVYQPFSKFYTSFSHPVRDF